MQNCGENGAAERMCRRKLAGLSEPKWRSSAPLWGPLVWWRYMLPATPEADELQQLPLELPRYLLVALRESGGHRAYALLPPYAPLLQRSPCLMA